MVNTNCVGNENSLLDCSHTGSFSNCDHSHDAGVRCIFGGEYVHSGGSLTFIKDDYCNRIYTCVWCMIFAHPCCDHC